MSFNSQPEIQTQTQTQTPNQPTVTRVHDSIMPVVSDFVQTLVTSEHDSIMSIVSEVVQITRTSTTNSIRSLVREYNCDDVDITCDNAENNCDGDDGNDSDNDSDNDDGDNDDGDNGDDDDNILCENCNGDEQTCMDCNPEYKFISNIYEWGNWFKTFQLVDQRSYFPCVSSFSCISNSSYIRGNNPEFSFPYVGDANFWLPYEGKCNPDTISLLSKFKNRTDEIVGQSEHNLILRTFEEEYKRLRKENELFCAEIGLKPLQFEYPLNANNGKFNKTRDQIRLKNTTARFLADTIGMKSKGVEIVGVTIETTKNRLTEENFVERSVIGILKLLVNATSPNTSVDELPNAINKLKYINDETLFDIWFGVGKFICQLRSLKVRNGYTADSDCDVYPLLINDLLYGYNNFIQKFVSRLKYDIVSKEHAQLFLKTSFDNILPGASAKPYDSQNEMLEFFRENISRPYLCVYNTIMGMGKTTTVIALVQILARLNPKKTFVYVCPEGLSAVRERIGSLLKQEKCLFAIASLDGEAGEF